MNRLYLILFLFWLPACSEISLSPPDPERYREAANSAKEQAVHAKEKEQVARHRATLPSEDIGVENPYSILSSEEDPYSILSSEWIWVAFSWERVGDSWNSAANAWDEAAIALTMHLEAMEKASATDQSIERERLTKESRIYSDLMLDKVAKAKEHEKQAVIQFDIAVRREAEAVLADTLPDSSS